VAGAYQTGVVLMRDLARRGVRVSGIDCNASMPGFHTVYGKVFLCPNPDTNPTDWVDFMIRLAGSLQARPGVKPVLIPSADQFVSAMSAHVEELQKYFAFCHTSSAAQAVLATKERQYEVAGQNGLSVPKTQFIRSLGELREFAAAARFPCLLKPVHFRHWERLSPGNPLYRQKVGTADTAEDLERQYRLASECSSEMVVQEIIAGPDSSKLVYLSCYGLDGRRLASCMVRQLRTDPISFGSASVVEPVRDPATDAACDGFLKAIGYTGICEIELKRDDRDGAVRMIEANPRFSVTADAASYAGVDLGWLHYLDLMGQAVEPVEPSGRAFRHIFLQRDFSCFRSYLRAGTVSWGGLLRTYASPVAFFDFDLKDWRVTGRTVVTLAKILAAPAVRRVFPKRRRPGDTG
jgi:predicted ATP-grasp superfamily ATP-dependent carboligase